MTGPHSYFGQQLAGSVPTTLAQAQRIAGQMLAAPVLNAALRSQTGQVYVSQQVFGSTPVFIGVRPFGQAIAIVGQVTRVRSHVGVCRVCGTHGRRTSAPCTRRWRRTRSSGR